MAFQTPGQKHEAHFECQRVTAEHRLHSCLSGLHFVDESKNVLPAIQSSSKLKPNGDLSLSYHGNSRAKSSGGLDVNGGSGGI